MKFIKNISILLTSNFLGSLLNFLVAPILTRIYSPDSFGFLALFISISTIAGMIVTLKWENIFFIETEISDAVLKLTILSILIVISIISAVFSIMWLKNFLLPEFYWVVLLCIYVIFLGLYYFGRAYHSSLGNYKILSISFITKILTANIFFLVSGYFFGDLYYFLLIGTIIGQLFENLLLLYKFDWKNLKFTIEKNKIKNLAYRHKKFPFFTLPGELISNLNSFMPIFFLNSYYGPKVTGYFSLIQRIFGIPLKLFTSSTAEVFRKEAAMEWKKNKNFKTLAMKTSFYLFLLGLLPAVFIFTFAEWIIPIFFGNQWMGAVPYLRIMSFIFILQFSISPISYGLYISEKQEIDFIWQLLLLILCTTAMYITLNYSNPIYTVVGYVITYFVMYIVYFLLIINNSSADVK